jgi:hypothetical protein
MGNGGEEEKLFDWQIFGKYSKGQSYSHRLTHDTTVDVNFSFQILLFLIINLLLL